MLKMQCRLYERTLASSVSLRNGLISLLDQTFPGVNRLFYPVGRETDGHVKWVDFVHAYWHRDCVTSLSKARFAESYRRWCQRTRYRFSPDQAERIYASAKETVASLPKTESTKLLIRQAVESLNAVYNILHTLRGEMLRLAHKLPEYEAVMTLTGAGKITEPKLMGEIGDVRRFTSKRALVAFAGVDAPPYQSGIFESKARRIFKRGSPLLRKTLFQMCGVSLQLSDPNDPIFVFMDRKRAEGKPFYVYMVAGAAKILRIYYARVKAHLNETAETEQSVA